MSMTVSESFASLFTAEVHHLYQQRGSVLRNRVRNRSITGNERVYFNRLGLGQATQKARHAEVPAMDVTHDRVECPVAAYYAAEYIDDLDQAQTNVALRAEYGTVIVNAMGRAIDDVILTELGNTTTAPIPVAASGLTFAKILEMQRRFNSANIPQDGRKVVIGPYQVRDFLSIVTAANHPVTTSGDFVTDRPLMAGELPRTFLGFEWIFSTRLPVSGGNTTIYAWHESAVGLAWGRDITPSIDWIAAKDSWLVKSKMLLGAKIIEDAGVLPIICQN